MIISTVILLCSPRGKVSDVFGRGIAVLTWVRGVELGNGPGEHRQGRVRHPPRHVLHRRAVQLQQHLRRLKMEITGNSNQSIQESKDTQKCTHGSKIGNTLTR